MYPKQKLAAYLNMSVSGCKVSVKKFAGKKFSPTAI
jgi:hypothetical protein